MSAAWCTEYKDHSVAVSVVPDGLLFSARPQDAPIHRALEMMADDILIELELCARLDRERPFGLYQGQTLPHRWEYPVNLIRDIKPLDESYVYIDGKLSPTLEDS